MAKRVGCLSNQKQLGLAGRNVIPADFSGRMAINDVDHHRRRPPPASTTNAWVAGNAKNTDIDPATITSSSIYVM